MHKLTKDRMNWGAAALLAGMAVGAVGLFGARSHPHRAVMRRPPKARTCCAPADRATLTAPYAHRIHRFSEDHSRVTIYDRRTGRVVWSRATGYVYQTVWSNDRRAFALVEDAGGSADSSFRLTVWRAGRGARSYVTIPPLPYLDAVDHLEWSSDDKRLLVLGARCQGSASVGHWELWCLDVERARAKMADSPGPVLEARWTGLRRIQYRAVRLFERNGIEDGVVDRAPREWACR
jgi:hypothetical protein